MIFAGIDVNIITHEKALAAGVEALGLWTWGMCYAQLHETNGRLPEVAVVSALGCERRLARRLAARLVSAGLWIANEDGSWSVWNYGRKNQTAEDIRRKKDQAAERVRRWREGRRNAVGNADVTQGERVRTDPSLQPSPEPDNTTRKQEGGAPSGVTLVTPSWVDAAIDAVTATTGETFDRGIVWAKYQGSRERDVRAIGQADFRSFLASWAGRQKSDRVNGRSNGARHVQSAENRAWTVPEDMP